MTKYFQTLKLNFNKEKVLYLISFVLPGLIFLSYFFYTKNGVLTVDLGQQYVDFLAFSEATCLLTRLDSFIHFQAA